jgi:replicative DNA helicase
LDQVVRGPANGEVFLVIARSHVGKSNVATNIMANNADSHIIFFSLEMPTHQVLHRLSAHVFNYPARDLELDEMARTLPTFVDELSERLPYQVIVDDSSLNLQEMAIYLEDYSTHFGQRPQLVIIDYMEEIQNAGGVEALGQLARAVKAWAKDERIGVVLLHQTNMGQDQWEPPTSNSARLAGYAQPLDEPVLTPTGWTTMGAVSVGDQVVGSQGRPTQVTGVFPLGRRQVYRVRFRDGGNTRATAEHLWQVLSSGARQHGYGARVLRTCELDTGKGGHSIPLVAPITGPYLDLPVNPYVLGALLGDGSFRPSANPIWDFTGEVVRCIRKEGYRVSGTGHRGGYGIPGIAPQIKELGLTGKKSRDKFVPDAYLRASVKQRLSLLRGLMDTDGTSGMSTSFATNSPHLRDGVVELVRSLGGVAKISARVTPRGPAWDVHLHEMPFNPFRIPSKARKWKPSTHKYPRRVVSVEPEGEAEVQCISVGAPDGLYVTKDYIVTHNTQADVVIGLWRPGWDPDKPPDLRDKQEHWLGVNVIKNRVRGLKHEGLLYRLDPAMRIVPVHPLEVSGMDDLTQVLGLDH